MMMQLYIKAFAFLTKALLRLIITFALISSNLILYIRVNF
jgi:hypothetical protein